MKAFLFPLFAIALLTDLRAASAENGVRRFSFDPETSDKSAIAVTSTDIYTDQRGYGFDLGTMPTKNENPFFFSVAVPEGTYRVTIRFGARNESSSNTVKAECRQLMLEQIETTPGQFVSRDFIVNVRDASLPPPPKNAPGGSSVVLNERETGILRWDHKLTLEFNGTHPHIAAITVVPAPEIPTIFLAGDSTVTDQPQEPAASWGQMLPRFLSGVAIANHAESGETMKSFLTELRLAKILSQIKTGDYLFIQFAHNDEKRQWPQTYVEAHTTYRAYLRVFIAEAKTHGATPVLVTSMQRRTFDAAGEIKNTHGDYPEVMREVAREENVPLIDLEKMSVAFYEALGPEKARLAFNGGGKDATHQDDYGAYELAKCVVNGIRDAHLPLTKNIVADFPAFDPAHPDAPESFIFAKTPGHTDIILRGN